MGNQRKMKKTKVNREKWEKNKMKEDCMNVKSNTGEMGDKESE